MIVFIKHVLRGFLLPLLLIAFISNIYAQQQPSVKTLINKIESYNAKLPAEKIYLQFDKPYYAVGDTIWFKSYVTTATLNYSPYSTKLYVDLVNDSNKVVKHLAVPVTLGMGWGDIELNDGNMPEGAYTIRAYTNWMRNFGETSFFYKSFYVSNTAANSWIVNTTDNLSGNNVKVGLKFSGVDKIPVSNQEMQVKVLSGKKTILRSTAVTSLDGTANVEVALPDNTRVKNLTLVAYDKKNPGKMASVPVSVERSQDVDVQFMPESGAMVTSLPAQVGFKAVGEDGRGVNVKGIVTDKENNTVAKFEAYHAGMGAFTMAPQPGEVYTAKITLPNGTVKSVNLPEARSTGTVLKVKNYADRDSIDLGILATTDLISSDKKYYLVGQSRGVVCYGASFTIDKQYVSVHVAKSLFPTGIAHFTILNTLNQPINERLAFVDHRDNLKINVQTSLNSYSPRDSIPLQLSVNNSEGNPVAGSFSVAVTDDSQVKDIAANTNNILSNFLLSSDLKGYVESPGYYLNGDAASWKALDALLLTQGWIGYDWKNMISGTIKTPFLPEPENAVTGKVSNLLNKPVVNSKILLLSTGKYSFIKDTTTNTDGRFYFRGIPLADSTKFVLTARNAKGRTINGGITLDQAPPVNAALPFDVMPQPWYVNTDTTLLNFVKNNSAYHLALEKRRYGGRLLRDVNIRDRASIKNSQNLNGTGNSDQSITEADIEKVGKGTLLDVLTQKVAGFHTRFAHKSTNLEYFIKDKRVRFVIDGIDLDRFYQPVSATANEHYEYQRQTLDYLTAEDIVGVEVMFSTKYLYNYNNRNLSTDEQLALTPTGPPGSEFAFLEITTRSGNGPFMKTSNAVYVYKPVQITFPKQFYRPRYLVKTGTPGFTDLRSTIHWQPNVITDKKGQAFVSFYAADKPATYTVIVEGSDLNGKVGYQTKKITVGSTTQ
jgi:hypothetical protein